MDSSAASTLEDAVITSSSSPAASSPSFSGHVETTLDALRLVCAAQAGTIPRIARRLDNAERSSLIKSGAVFIFNVQESGIKRWGGMYYALGHLRTAAQKLTAFLFRSDGIIWSE